MSENRLSKIIARAGIASRRAAEKLIFEGKVEVNGAKILVPQTLVNPEKDRIALDGILIKKEDPKVIFLLNKPKGYICSNTRIGSKKLVFDLFQEIPYRLFSVGRLDRDTTGLLLVTNDGHFAHQIMHPRFGLSKEYLLKTAKEVTHGHLTSLMEGVRIEGKWVKPVGVQKVRNGTLKIIVKEGKKHEVRILAKKAGLQLLELKRIRIGSLVLGKLPEGNFRLLTEKEKFLLLSPKSDHEV